MTIPKGRTTYQWTKMDHAKFIAEVALVNGLTGAALYVAMGAVGLTIHHWVAFYGAYIRKDKP